MATSSQKWVLNVSTPNGTGGFMWADAMSNATAATNTWVHLIGVFDAGSGQTTLYVNGVAQTTKGSGAAGWHSTDSLLLGTNNTTYYAGLIDQVKVYQGAMNAREAAALYNAG